MKFFVAQTSITFFSQKVEKLNISAIYDFYFFSESSFVIYLFLICKKKKKIQPPGEPRKHRLGDVLKRRSNYKFNIILSY